MNISVIFLLINTNNSSPSLFLFQNTVYKGEFTATHPTVRLFWEVFHEFPLEKKKQFLRKCVIT